MQWSVLVCLSVSLGQCARKRRCISRCWTDRGFERRRRGGDLGTPFSGRGGGNFGAGGALLNLCIKSQLQFTRVSEAAKVGYRARLPTESHGHADDAVNSLEEVGRGGFRSEQGEGEERKEGRSDDQGGLARRYPIRRQSRKQNSFYRHRRGNRTFHHFKGQD